MSRLGCRWWSSSGCFYRQGSGLHKGQASSFAEHEQEQWVRLVWGHRGRRSFRLTMTSKMLFGRWSWYCDLLIIEKNAIDMRLSRMASSGLCSWSCGSLIMIMCLSRS